MKFSRLTSIIFFAFLLTAPAHVRAASEPAKAFPSPEFQVEGVLRKNFEFWVQIYGKYTTEQAVIHDSKHIDLIYEVLDLKSDSSGTKGSRRSAGRLQREAKAKWRKILLSLHKKQVALHPTAESFEKLSDEEKHVFQLFSQVNEPNKFLAAAHRKRLRIQLGQKDRFQQGYVMSGRYLKRMEEIFRREGLPLELTRLPFVESSFNVRARSKVGASGIWQFMRSTGRLYLKINSAVDERNDPIRATEAAAKLLKLNYESLGNWPLAVTAYNHGRMGLMRAVRQLGSDRLESLVQDYRKRSFGFASSNFFTCLAAALEVERRAEEFFGPVVRDEPPAAYEVEIPDPISFRELASFLKLDSTAIQQLNPALTTEVFRNLSRIPAGYRLRLPLQSGYEPETQARIFLAGYHAIPKAFKRAVRKR